MPAKKSSPASYPAGLDFFAVRLNAKCGSLVLIADRLCSLLLFAATTLSAFVLVGSRGFVKRLRWKSKTGLPEKRFTFSNVPFLPRNSHWGSELPAACPSWLPASPNAVSFSRKAAAYGGWHDFARKTAGLSALKFNLKPIFYQHGDRNNATSNRLRSVGPP